MNFSLNDQIIQFLQATDDHAVENVRQGIGGPFGARFLILTEDGAVIPVGMNVGNAVLSSGVASRHAEHENWTQNLPDLIDKLAALKGKRKTLIELSSAESCINCHAKQQAGIAWLRSQGLLEAEDEARVIFGATYRETADVAGFNDLVYLLALQEIMGLPENAGDHNPVGDRDRRIATQFA